MPHPESDYNLTRLIALNKHKLFTDPRGIEPAVVYCPEKENFTYADNLNTELGFSAICCHCYNVIT